MPETTRQLLAVNKLKWEDPVVPPPGVTTRLSVGCEGLHKDQSTQAHTITINTGPCNNHLHRPTLSNSTHWEKEQGCKLRQWYVTKHHWLSLPAVTRLLQWQHNQQMYNLQTEWSKSDMKRSFISIIPQKCYNLEYEPCDLRQLFDFFCHNLTQTSNIYRALLNGFTCSTSIDLTLPPVKWEP